MSSLARGTTDANNLSHYLKAGTGGGIRGQATSLAKGGFGKSRMDLQQLLQGALDRFLAHTQVGILGSLPLLDRSHADADCQPSACHGKNHGQFILSQRANNMIPFDDTHGSLQRIGLVEHGVGNGDGQTTNRIAMDISPKSMSPTTC